MKAISEMTASPIEQALKDTIENEPLPTYPPVKATPQPGLAELQQMTLLHVYASYVPGYSLATTSRFIDPKFMGRFRRGLNDQRATVQEDGSLTLFGERLVLANQHDYLMPGTEVVVYLGGRSFMCAPVKRIEAHITQVEAKDAELKERERIRQNELRDEAIAFNARLPISVKWVPGIKDVLSGLSEKSDGTGMMRASVIHVYLEEDLHVGRLNRAKGDFLCGNSKAKWGARYIQPEILCPDGDGKMFPPKVTCKTCLEIAKRVKIAAGKSAKGM